MSESRYSTSRSLGREHFPQTPKGFIAIRIVQLILAVAVLGLDAYVLSNVLFDGAELTIFSSLATLIACIYYLVVEFGKDAWKGYNYWAVLSLDIFLLMFWLVSFALDAARVAPFANGWTICDGFECIYYPVEDYMTLFACMCTTTGLAGVEFALFIVSLSIHSVAMHRHRAAGLHCKPLSALDRDVNSNNATFVTTNANSNNNNNNNNNNHHAIPLQEKHDHAAPSYVSSIPQPAPAPPSQHQQQHQQSAQSLYAASQPSMSPQTTTSPYQPPAVPTTTTGGGYHTHHHHSSGVESGFGGPGMTVPAPHPGSYEAPVSSSSGGYA